jgi:hypothetical protein
MPIAPATRRGAVLLSALLALVAGAEEHETSQPDDASAEASRWWASVGLEGGAFVSGLEGSAMSSDIANPPINNPQPIRPPASDSHSYVVPYLEGSLELFGPATIGGVRPFVSGGLGGDFSVSKDIAKEGTTGDFAVPPPPGGFGSTTATDELEDLIRGQGTRLTSQFSSFFLTAGIGVAVPFETESHSFRVKPSFRYLRDEVEAEGVVQRAVLLMPGIAQINPKTLDDFRLITLSASDTRAFDSIGPGLEIDTDLSRNGRVVASVFVAGAVYFLVGDRAFDFTATNPEGEYARFRVERDPFSYRFGIGVRLRFEP